MKNKKVVPKFIWGASTKDWENESLAFMRYKDPNEKDVSENKNKKYYLRDRN